MSDRLRLHLQEQIAKKVQAHGLVVWDDPEAQYLTIAESVCPADTGFARWDGSWYDLRRHAESALAADKALPFIVYVPTQPPPDDPLEEIRAASHRFRLKLPTLISQAMNGQLTEDRIEEIGRQARNLGEAEAALAGGDAEDVRLINVLASADTTHMVLAVMCGERDEEIGRDDAWSIVSELFERAIGGSFEADGDKLRRAAMQQLILTEIAETLGDIPKVLESAWSPPASEQVKRILAILDTWRRDERRRNSYAKAATVVEGDLDLANVLSWHAGFASTDSVPAVEAVALGEAVRLLARRDFNGAQQLAAARLAASIWVRTPLEHPLQGAEVWGPRWRVVESVADLHVAMLQNKPQDGSVARQLRSYAESGWRVDRAHRRMELALTELHTAGELEGPIGEARAVYESWLDELLGRFTTTVASEGLDVKGVMRQVEIHPRLVSKSNGLTAYMWVDALRFEIGNELADALQRVCAKVEISHTVASIPTITPIGMASLCPGADVGLGIELDARRRMIVKVGDKEIKSVDDRRNLLRAAHGELVDLLLSDVVGRGEKELGKMISGAALVLVRSQEMDVAGESGMLALTWTGLDEIKDQIVHAVARLGQAGVSRFVIAADHGFVVLSRALRTDRVVEAPAGGTGDLHRRSWVGRGAATTPSTLRLALGEAGVTSDLDLIVPRTLAVFAKPGTRQFFHGGLSPQELVVPVIVAETERSVAPKGRRVTVAVAGSRLTTGAFSVTISFEPDLFTSELEVRVVARRLSDKSKVARLVAGEGYDVAAGTARLSADQHNVLTFQLTANLSRGEEVEVAVLDARTDRELGSTTVAASTAIDVEEDLV